MSQPLRPPMLKSTALLSGGQIIGQGCSFIRNIILARLLGAEHMGIAATFAITIALFTMISDVMANMLLIQADDGDEPRFQNTIHLLYVIKGLFTSAIIFALAWPFAAMFRQPQALWAFQCLALVPVMRGFAHQDMARYQREMRFAAQVRVELFAQLIALAAAWPMAILLRDYTAVLWLVILEAAVFMIGSHLVAQRAYRWAFDGIYLRRVIAFGWPLMLNGMFMFGTFYGDRAIVGTFYEIRELGVYAVAFALTLTPSLMLARVSTSLILPALSAVRQDKAAFERLIRRSMHIMALTSATMGLGFIFFGGIAMQWLYGPAYSNAGSIIAWLGAAQAIRLLRVAPNQAALALGETVNTMLGNTARLLGVFAAFLVAANHAPLEWIAASAVLGEMFAAILSVLLLHQNHNIVLVRWPCRNPLNPTITPVIEGMRK